MGIDTSDDTETQTRGRRGGRRGKRAGGAGRTIEQAPWQQPRVPFPPMKFISDDEIEAIHNTSLKALEEIGMDFLLPEARELLKKAGADVDPNSDRVRFDRAMIEETIKTAPSEFTMHARNPAHNLQMGGSWMAFGCVSSPPNASDIDNGRRTGNTKDFQNLLRLSQYFNMIHFIGGYPVEPVDRHASIRHLDCLRDMVHLTDKVIHAYSLARSGSSTAWRSSRSPAAFPTSSSNGNRR